MLVNHLYTPSRIQYSLATRRHTLVNSLHSDQKSANSTENTAPANGTPTLETVIKVLKHKARWTALRILARGEALPVNVLARHAGVRPDIMSKHMLILKSLGIVVTGYGHLYTLAPAYRPAPGTLTIDLGHCLVRPAPATGAPG